MTILYDYWRSSAAYRLRIALRLKGVAHRAVEVNLLDGAHRGAENLARNPQGLVPTLEIDGHTLTQSIAILEYLEETRPTPPLLPTSPTDRAQVRALVGAIAMEIHPVLNMSVARFGASLSDDMTMQGWMQAFMPERLEALDAMTAATAGRYCFGDTVTMADVCLAPQLYNARRWECAIPERLAKIDSRLAEIPAFAEAVPERVKPD